MLENFMNKKLQHYNDVFEEDCHCAICGSKIKAGSTDGIVSDGKRSWICDKCFEKYYDEYKWTTDDWRIMAQEFYMKSVEVKHVPHFKKFSDEWDHEHCEFCWAKFMEGDYPNVIHEGYCTLDEKHWICPTCYEDFKERFRWKLVEDESEQP